MNRGGLRALAFLPCARTGPLDVTPDDETSQCDTRCRSEVEVPIRVAGLQYDSTSSPGTRRKWRSFLVTMGIP